MPAIVLLALFISAAVMNARTKVQSFVRGAFYLPTVVDPHGLNDGVEGKNGKQDPSGWMTSPQLPTESWRTTPET